MKPPLTSVWTRPSRPAKSPALSRPQIVRAAVELLDAQGMDALSMRRLAARLGSGATSIYWHVANKDELLDLVLDEVFGEVPLPDPEVSWRETASMFAYGLRATLFAHPWSVTLIGARATVGPNAIRLTARLLETFTAAGFRGHSLDRASSTLLAYVLGATTPEIAWRSTMADTGVSEQECFEAGREIMEQTARDYPELLARYAEYDGTDVTVVRALNFDFGLTCVLDGLEAHLRRSDVPPAPEGGSPSGAGRPEGLMGAR